MERIEAFVLRAETALLAHFGMRGGLFSSPYRKPATTPLLAPVATPVRATAPPGAAVA